MTFAELKDFAARHGKVLVSKCAWETLCAQVAAAIMAEAETSGELEAFLR